MTMSKKKTQDPYAWLRGVTVATRDLAEVCANTTEERLKKEQNDENKSDVSLVTSLARIHDLNLNAQTIKGVSEEYVNSVPSTKIKMGTE